MNNKMQMQPMTVADWILAGIGLPLIAGMVFSGLTAQADLGAELSAALSFVGWWSFTGSVVVAGICMSIRDAKRSQEEA